MADFGIAEFAAISAVVSAGVGAAASAKQASDASDIAKYNADAQRKSALSAENEGAAKAADARLKARRVISSQVAAEAGSGLRTDTGTALDLASEAASFGELDSLRITNNAQRSAWGYKTQAGLDEFQGESARTAGYMNAGGTLLGGASNAYFGYRKAGGAY